MSFAATIFESEALTMIKRDGIRELLDYLRDTDFYEAPASTRFHGANAEGLVNHSLTVYNWIFKIRDSFHRMNCDICYASSESLAIVSLFHDICKINTYKIDYRNVKDPETGKWDRVPYYTVDDKSGFGAHGAKSVFLINQYMKLTMEETVAILHHMGAWDKSTYSDPGKAYDTYSLAWLLHVADEAASYISKT